MSAGKFYVGQPVWAIYAPTGKWYAGIVRDENRTRLGYTLTTGQIAMFLTYLVELLNDPFHSGGEYGVCESHLRPRDPDQHTASTERFDELVRETEGVQ